MNIIKKADKRIKWEWLKMADAIARRRLKFPEVMSQTETIRRVVDAGLSITRFGDGELSLMCGRDLNFQTYDPALAEKMEQAMRSDNPRLMVCIPDCFTEAGLNTLCEVDNRFWRSHLMYFRKQWARRLNPRMRYGNTWVTRIYSMKWNKPEAEKIYAELSRIWEGKDVVMIEGEASRLGVGNECFASARSIRRILAPRTNSFARYDDILAAAMAVEGNPLFLLAMGPTATAMAAELANAGRRALDIGHLDIEYEWMRMDATTKLPVRGKFSNEAFLTGQTASEVTGDLTPAEWALYKSQIIADFSK